MEAVLLKPHDQMSNELNNAYNNNNNNNKEE